MLATAAGLILLLQPAIGAVSLTALLVVFFIIEGMTTVAYAFEHRHELAGRWEWMLVSGIIDLFLSRSSSSWAFPATAAWARSASWSAAST